MMVGDFNLTLFSPTALKRSRTRLQLVRGDN